MLHLDDSEYYDEDLAPQDLHDYEPEAYHQAYNNDHLSVHEANEFHKDDGKASASQPNYVGQHSVSREQASEDQGSIPESCVEGDNDPKDQKVANDNDGVQSFPEEHFDDEIDY